MMNMMNMAPEELQQEKCYSNSASVSFKRKRKLWQDKKNLRILGNSMVKHSKRYEK